LAAPASVWSRAARGEDALESASASLFEILFRTLRAGLDERERSAP
jgi:hypothetical protein